MERSSANIVSHSWRRPADPSLHSTSVLLLISTLNLSQSVLPVALSQLCFSLCHSVISILCLALVLSVYLSLALSPLTFPPLYISLPHPLTQSLALLALCMATRDLTGSPTLSGSTLPSSWTHRARPFPPSSGSPLADEEPSLGFSKDPASSNALS